MSTSPFAKVDRDCLLATFDIITSHIPAHHSDPDRPLNVVQAALQVCHQWREILIGSPWIWGRVVDLGSHLCHGPERRQWMDVVVKRAQSSPLWISGTIYDGDEYCGLFDRQGFFIALLGSWERIEKLSIVIHSQKVPEEIWSCFLSRAPILKLFDLHLPDLDPRNYFFSDNLDSGCAKGSLFGDHAPALQHLRADYMPFEVDSPWLHHIRAITPPWTNVNEIFVLLQQCPDLETIVINPSYQYIEWKKPSTTGVVPHYRPANLPSLLSVKIDAAFDDAAGILERADTAVSVHISVVIIHSDLCTTCGDYHVQDFR